MMLFTFLRMNPIGSLSNIVLLLFLGFLCSLLTVWFIRFLAQRRGWMAEPKADRWHQSPTALHGGIGMILGWIPLALWVLMRHPDEQKMVVGFLAGSIIMFLLGLVDDFMHFQPSTKLVWQIVAASLLIGQGVVIQILPWYSANVLLTFIWFIGIINAVNMLDNMDGLATGVVAISSLVLLVIFVTRGGASSLAVAWLAIFIGVLFGFLFYNFNPASIFMGDSGSLFIGYFLAAMSIPSPINHNWFLKTGEEVAPWGLISLLAPAMILAVPIFDTTLVTLSRKWHGRSASQGGLDHSSHRLVGLGLSEREAVSILYGVALIGGVISILSHFYERVAGPLFTGFFVLLVVFGFYLGRLSVYEEGSKTESWTPLVTGLLHKRRFTEAMADFFFVVIAYTFTFVFLLKGKSGTDVFYERTLPWVVAIMMFTFWFFGYYRGRWHLFKMKDLGRTIQGLLLGGIFLVGFYFLNQSNHLNLWPVLRQNYIQFCTFFLISLFILIAGFRMLSRILDHYLQRKNYKLSLYQATATFNPSAKDIVGS